MWHMHGWFGLVWFVFASAKIRMTKDSNDQNFREVELSWLKTPRHSSACGHFGGILEIPVIPAPRLVFAHAPRRSTTKVCESFALACETQKIPTLNDKLSQS
jgi:hypothetical protein